MQKFSSPLPAEIGLWGLTHSRPDTLFPLASMSKPITSSAVMQLVENGSFLLIRNCQISSLIWFDVGCAERKLGCQFEPAVKQITIEDLLTHRSGLTYAPK